MPRKETNSPQDARTSSGISFFNRNAAERTTSPRQTISGATVGRRKRGPQVSSLGQNSGANPGTKPARVSSAKPVTRRSSRQALGIPTRDSSMTGQYISRPLLRDRKSDIAFRTAGRGGTVLLAMVATSPPLHAGEYDLETAPIP